MGVLVCSEIPIPSLPGHSSRITRHSSRITHPSSLVTHHSSRITRHSSRITRHSSRITRHSSRITRHSSLVTRHSSLVTHHSSQAACVADERLLARLISCWASIEWLRLSDSSNIDGSSRRKQLDSRPVFHNQMFAEEKLAAGAKVVDGPNQRQVPLVLLQHFLRLGGSPVRDLLKYKLFEIERLWLSSMVELVVSQPLYRLTTELRSIAQLDKAAAVPVSPLMHTLSLTTPSASFEHFVAERDALLSTVIGGLASQLPPLPPLPPDADSKRQQQQQQQQQQHKDHEERIKKMAQLLPKLLEECVGSQPLPHHHHQPQQQQQRPAGGRGGGSVGGGRGGVSTSVATGRPSKAAVKYADFAVQLAGLLLSKLPHVMCANTGVAGRTLVDLVVSASSGQLCPKEVIPSHQSSAISH